MFHFRNQHFKRKIRSSNSSKDLVYKQAFDHTNPSLHFFFIAFLYSQERRQFQWPNSQKLFVRYLQSHIFIIP